MSEMERCTVCGSAKTLYMIGPLRFCKDHKVEASAASTSYMNRRIARTQIAHVATMGAWSYGPSQLAKRKREVIKNGVPFRKRPVTEVKLSRG